MDEHTLWWTAALTTGLVGSLHCVGMCGPLAMALPVGRLPHAQRGLAIGLYHVGRVTAYALLGLVIGTLGQGVLLAGLQRPVSVTAGVLLLLWLIINKGKLSGLTMSRATRWVVQPMTRFLHTPTLRAFAGLGFLNGLLPCGFVYVAMAGAITTTDATRGAIYMGLFGLGTVPALLLVRFIPDLFPMALRRRFTFFMPVATILLALLLVVRGLYNPATTGGRAEHPIPMCHGGQVSVVQIDPAR